MNDVTKAMIDLLFSIEKAYVVYNKANDMFVRNSDWEYGESSYVRPIDSLVEKSIVKSLDLFFEETTGHETLASFMLYDSGMQIWNGVEYNLKDRADFERLIEASTKEILSINNGETP